MASGAWRGLRLLLVEDETLLAMMMEDILREMGCTIAGSAATLAKALDLARALPLDCAVLDINVAGQSAYAVAEILAERGIPFVFTTGYDPAGIDRRFSHAPVLRKPFEPEDLQRALSRSLRRSSG